MRRPSREPGLHWTVDAVVRQCPGAAAVFTRFRMACIGCAMAPFETLADAAAAYRVRPNRLRAAFRRPSAPTRTPRGA